MPLNDAFTQAKNRLGSYDLTARDLTQHARARRLTIAVRVIWPDRTEQAFILRSAFWRWYGIDEARRLVGDTMQRAGTATVRQMCGNPTPLLGDWHLFVGRRRFERLYAKVESSDRRPGTQSTERPSTEQPQRSETSGKRKRRAPQVELARKLMTITFPEDQWRDLDPTEVERGCGKDPRVKEALKEKGAALPSSASFARAMGRRS
jgi:hypothetical protein